MFQDLHQNVDSFLPINNSAHDFLKERKKESKKESKIERNLKIGKTHEFVL
jgi:hypothetical protein